jgi:hypothetical protein
MQCETSLTIVAAGEETILKLYRTVTMSLSCDGLVSAEILITAGGENIPSAKIELAVKERLPMISNCMLIGDRRHYLTMFLTLKVGSEMLSNNFSDFCTLVSCT